MGLFGNDKQKTTINSSGYNGSEPTRICPNCGKEKPISEFGFRKMGNGEVRNQSWCKDCRQFWCSKSINTY